MKVDLNYGYTSISLNIPEQNLARMIEPWRQPEAKNGEIVASALRCNKWETFCRKSAGKRVCVLLPDSSRDMPLKDIVPRLLPALRTCARVDFIVCTGTHQAQTPSNIAVLENVKVAAERAGLHKCRFHIHDGEQDRLINAGTTAQGTRVFYNSFIDEADVFFVLSDVKVHYFAGYSNAIKYFVPGICGFETAEKNHSLALDENATFGLHPWHSNIARRENRLAQDQLEAMGLIVKERLVWAFVTASTSGSIQWAQFGQAKEVTRAAFDVVDRQNAFTVKPVSYLVISPGGMPNDVDLYIAHRALELTKAAVLDGGEVLFLSACPKGVGERQTRENFYELLTAPLDKILSTVEAHYRLFSHKPYKLAQLIARLRRIWLFSAISDAVVESIHLLPTSKPQDVVDAWLGEDAAAQIIVVNGANKVALYAE